MNLIKRTSLNLSKVQANIIERNISKYFDVTIPKQLKAGKNEIKLKLLRPDIFVEGSSLLIDFYSDNEQNFNYYISEIANADSSRSIIVAIDQESVNGPCHLYIMSDMKDGRVYLYIVDLEVNTYLENTQDIKFNAFPEVTYSEVVKPTQVTSNVSRTLTVISNNQKINSKATIIPQQLLTSQFNIEKPEVQTSVTVNSLTTVGSSSQQVLPKFTSPAIIHSDDFKFSSSMANGTIEVNGLTGGKYIATILRVINTSSIEVWPPYNNLVDDVLYNSFSSHQNFTCSFNNSIQIVNSTYNQSYAVFNIYNLETSVGVVDSVNINYKILNQIGVDYQPIGNFKIISHNLLVDTSSFVFDPYYGVIEKEIGKFRNESDYFSYWMSGSSQVVKVYSDTTLPNGILVATTEGHFFPKNDYKIYGIVGSEFRLTFDYDNKYKDQLDVFITGSSVESTQIQNNIDKIPDEIYGSYIGSVNERTGNAVFDFKLRESGYFRPLFRLRNEVWNLANITVSPKKILGYSPNQTRIITPLSLPSGSELGFRFEYVNPAGKSTPNNVSNITGVFFSGGTVNSGGGPVSVPQGTVSSSNQLTSSYDARYETRGNNIVSSSVQVKNLLPNNTISSSLQFNNPTSPFTGSFSGDGSGLYNLPISPGSLPNGTVSGSNQLTSSYDARYETRGNNIVSSSAQVKAFLPLGSVSGSDQATSSYDTRYERKGTNIFSSSAQVVYSSITGIPTNLVTGSNQLTSSYDTRYEIRGNNIVSSSGQVKTLLPNDLVSSSAQISYTGISNVPANIVSGSNQLTSSYDTRYELRGSNIISSSGQFTSFSSPFTGSFTGSFFGSFSGDGSALYNIPMVSGSVPAGTVTGSDQLTSSYDTRYERKGTNIFSSSAQVIYGSITGIPTGLVTGSNQLTSSYDTRYEIRGSNIVSSSAQVISAFPTGVVSGSNQLTSSYDTRYEIRGSNIISSSNQLTSSYDVRYERKGTDIVSSSAQVKNLLPANTVSSSLQFSNLSSPFTGSFTGSFNGLFTGDGSGLYNIPLVSGSVPNGTITGSDQLTSSYDTRYERKGTNIFSSSAQVTFSGITGVPSTLISGSNQLTSSYDIRYETKGSNIFSSSAQVNFSGITGLPSTIVSGSNQLTSSYDTRYEIRGSNIVSSSAQIKDFLPSNVVSGSEQLTSSYDTRYERKGTNIFSSSVQVIYNSITGVPADLVSGSSQLTSSYDTRYEIRGSNIISSSTQIKAFLPNGTISGSDQITSSYDTRYEQRGSNIFSSSAQVNFSGITGLPSTLISGSNQLTSSYDTRYEVRGNNIVSSSAQIKAFLPSNSVSGSEQLTSSYDTRYERKGTNIFSSSAQVTFSGITGVPSTLVSGSDQLTSSYDTRYEIRGNNIVSSSAQVKNLLPATSVSGSDQLTSSYDTRYERKGTNIFSSSAQVTFSGITGIPSTLVSGSDQLTSSYDTRYEIRGNNIVSSSVQIKALLPLNSVSGSDQLTSSYDVRFERKGTNIFSSSAQVLSVLPAGTVTGSNQLTSSYDTRYEIRGNNIISSSAQIKSLLPAASVSGSDQLTSSYDTRYETRGSSIVSSSAQVKNFLPANTVSSSAQFTNTSSPFTGSFTGSFAGDGSGLTNLPITPGTVPPGTVSSSLQFNSTTFPFTGSFNGNFEGSGSGLTNIPGTAITPGYFALLTSNIFSGSQEIQGSGSKIFSVQGSVGELFAVFDGLSGSLFAVKNISGLPIFEVFSDNQVKIGQYGSEPIKISGSQAIVTGSFSGDGSGLTNLPTSTLPPNLVSGSNQLTSSYDARYERKGTNIFSSSAQVTFSGIIGTPLGLVSSSNQLTSSYDTRYERKGTNIFSSSAQVNYNDVINKPVITLPQSDRLLSSDGTVSGSRANDGLQYVSSSKWTKLLLRTNVIQEQTYSSSFWSSQWTFVSQSTFVATPANRNFSVYVPAGFNNDTNAPITSSTFHSSYAIEVENHIYGVTGSMSNPLNAYNWNSTTQFRAYYNPANFSASPLISGYSAQSSSVYNGMGGYGGAYTGRPDLNAWYSVTGVSYAGDGLFKVDLTLGPSSSFGWTLYIATTAKVIKHEIRV